MRAPKLAQPLLVGGRIGKDPAAHRAVVHFEAAFPEHLFQVSIAKRIAQILDHCLHYQPCLAMPPFVIILRLALQLVGNGIQNQDNAPLHRERNFHGRSQQRVNHENLRQAYR